MSDVKELTKMLPLVRVAYGKEDTPVELREYHVEGQNFPVGTLEEWEKFGKQKGFDAMTVNGIEVTVLKLEE